MCGLFRVCSHMWWSRDSNPELVCLTTLLFSTRALKIDLGLDLVQTHSCCSRGAGRNDYLET